MRKKRYILSFLTIWMACNTQVEAAWTLKNGRLVDASEIATKPVQDHYQEGCQAMESKDWETAAREFKIVTTNFPHSSFASDSLYYLGVSYYHLEEFDFANDAFSDYLKSKSHPSFFQHAIEYKFFIAENFTYGAKRRLLGTRQLPKWASGRTMALKIYDEVIAALPCHQIAAKAMFSKGNLLWGMKNYRESVDSFQMLIRRFPKDELAPASYLLITKLYLDQSQNEFQNPDLLAFAQINVRRFKQDFPRDERLEEAEKIVLNIKEIYANGLYETAQFYERTHRIKASVIYYHNAINQFPETSVAQRCQDRLAQITRTRSAANNQ